MFKAKNTARTKWDMDKVVTFDIEAYDWTNPIALGMYFGKYDTYREYISENCIEEFCKEILTDKWRNHRFVAHNGGKYDFIPVIECLSEIIEKKNRKISENKRWRLDILTKGPSDTPFFVKIVREYYDFDTEKWKDDSRTRYLQDSLALMPRGLDYLAESFAPNMPKLDFDVSLLDELENMDSELIDEMREYLKRDCKTLFKVLNEFSDIIHNLTDGVVGPQLTIGSTSMAVFQSYFMDKDLTINNCFKPDNKQNPEGCFRDSYFGGRTEVYKMYGENLKHYDVNSLYPFVYTNKPLPIGNVVNTGKDFPIDNNTYGGVLKINGYVPENGAYGFPVLPSRIKGDWSADKIIFGCGNISGWYMANEVRYALKVGALENVEIIDSYASRYGKPFEDFGNELYKLKSEIDSENKPGKYIIVKLLLNSFYGKFGMEREQSKVVHGPQTAEFQVGKRDINEELANKGFMLEDEIAQSKYILPRIASGITAWARIEMHKWFMRVKEKGGDIWYCDTDSIVTDIELEESEELGGMDLEGDLKSGVFLAPKVYAENYTDSDVNKGKKYLVKAKGMREPPLSYYHFEKAFQDNLPHLVQSSWNSPKGFKAGMKAGGNTWFVKNNYSRSLKKFDQKRYHANNESRPHNIEEL